MLVSVRFWIKGRGPSADSPESFWSAFQEANPKHISGSGREEYESKLRKRFPTALEKRLNERLHENWNADIKRRFSWRLFLKWLGPPRVEVSIVKIRYGSIELILSLLGISNDAMRDFILGELGAFAIGAFNEALDSNAALDVTIDPEIQGTGLDRQTMNRTWLILNTSLVVPVLIAAAICYYWSNGLLHQLDGLREESKELRTERTEIVKALVDQNTKISATIVEHAKSSVASAKAMETLLVTLVKDKINNPGCQPPNKCPEPEKPAGPVVKQEPPSNNFNLCFISPAFADGPQRPRPRHSPGRRHHTLCPRPSPPSQPYQP
jgi:hypothetical protein